MLNKLPSQGVKLYLQFIPLTTEQEGGLFVAIDCSWHNTLTHHGEDTWLELVKVTAACTEENLVLPKLVRYELLSLRDGMSEAKISNNVPRQEECLQECKRLLTYYAALRAFKRGSPQITGTLDKLTSITRVRQVTYRA
jgi:hypothetical protein